MKIASTIAVVLSRAACGEANGPVVVDSGGGGFDSLCATSCSSCNPVTQTIFDYADVSTGLCDP